MIIRSFYTHYKTLLNIDNVQEVTKYPVDSGEIKQSWDIGGKKAHSIQWNEKFIDTPRPICERTNLLHLKIKNDTIVLQAIWSWKQRYLFLNQVPLQH